MPTVNISLSKVIVAPSSARTSITKLVDAVGKAIPNATLPNVDPSFSWYGDGAKFRAMAQVPFLMGPFPNQSGQDEWFGGMKVGNLTGTAGADLDDSSRNQVVLNGSKFVMKGLEYEVKSRSNSALGYELELSFKGQQEADLRIANMFGAVIADIPVPVVAGGTKEELGVSYAKGLSDIGDFVGKQASSLNALSNSIKFVKSCYMGMVNSKEKIHFENGYTTKNAAQRVLTFDNPTDSFWKYNQQAFETESSALTDGNRGISYAIMGAVNSKSSSKYDASKLTTDSPSTIRSVPQNWEVTAGRAGTGLVIGARKAIKMPYRDPVYDDVLYTAPLTIMRVSGYSYISSVADAAVYSSIVANKEQVAIARLTSDYNLLINELQTEVIDDILLEFPDISWGNVLGQSRVNLVDAITDLNDYVKEGDNSLNPVYAYFRTLDPDLINISIDSSYDSAAYTAVKLEKQMISLSAQADSELFSVLVDEATQGLRNSLLNDFLLIAAKQVADQWFILSDMTREEVDSITGIYGKEEFVEYDASSGIIPAIKVVASQFKEYHCGTLIIGSPGIVDMFRGSVVPDDLKDIDGIQAGFEKRPDSMDLLLFKLAEGRLIYGSAFNWDFMMGHTVSTHGFNTVYVYPDDASGDLKSRLFVAIRKAMSKNSTLARTTSPIDLASQFEKHFKSFEGMGLELNGARICCWSESKLKQYILEKPFNTSLPEEENV